MTSPGYRLVIASSIRGRQWRARASQLRFLLGEPIREPCRIGRIREAPSPEPEMGGPAAHGHAGPFGPEYSIRIFQWVVNASREGVEEHPRSMISESACPLVWVTIRPQYREQGQNAQVSCTRAPLIEIAMIPSTPSAGGLHNSPDTWSQHPPQLAGSCAQPPLEQASRGEVRRSCRWSGHGGPRILERLTGLVRLERPLSGPNCRWLMPKSVLSVSRRAPSAEWTSYMMYWATSPVYYYIPPPSSNNRRYKPADPLFRLG